MNELPLNQVLCGDCREIMKTFPDDSIDLVVTDPPYGLSFMGKDWDKTLPPKQAFEEMIRVLKPGALTFVMSSPRQDVLWRMLAMLEGVGFELTQSYIEWIYKTGFPKAYDVSKGIDRKLGLFNERKTGNRYIAPDGKVRRAEDHKPNEEIRNPSTDYGYKTSGFRIDSFAIPASNLGKKWDGWKSQTGLKPAHEPILMMNKPFSESTIVDNVLKWGTGAINIDACRIPTTDDLEKDWKVNRKNQDDNLYDLGLAKKYSGGQEEYFNPKGRFPANLLVSDRALDTGKLSKSGTLEPHHKINSSKTRNIYGEYEDQPPEEHITYGDVGDQSRYFDLDAWAEHRGFLDVPKPDKTERDFGLKGKKKVPKSKFNLSDGSKDMRFDGVIPTPRRNIHPTVKPIKLMAYLIELGCPPSGVVLDPFVGSGTTCIAAKQLVRKYIGIEVNPEYVAIARARINAYPVPIDWFGVPPKVREND